VFSLFSSSLLFGRLTKGGFGQVRFETVDTAGVSIPCRHGYIYYPGIAGIPSFILSGLLQIMPLVFLLSGTEPSA
jgi:hypothetical protein